jgi:hypothetical protein
MSSTSYNRVLQSISFVINRYSQLPIVSRFQIYDTLQDYLLEQEFRIQTLESQIKILELKIAQNSKSASIDTSLNTSLATSLVINKEKDKSLMKI